MNYSLHSLLLIVSSFRLSPPLGGQETRTERYLRSAAAEGRSEELGRKDCAEARGACASRQILLQAQSQAGAGKLPLLLEDMLVDHD